MPLVVTAGPRLFVSSPAQAAAIQFVESAEDDHDFLTQSTLPDGFGDGASELRFRVRLDSGATWTQTNTTPYSVTDWWWDMDFLLDGHNNTNFYAGTYSFGFYNNGTPRWLIGNGATANARTGDLHAVQGGTSLLDGEEHLISLVTEFTGGNTVYSLYVDEVLIDTETATGAQINMATTYWDGGFPGFTVNQRFFCWGAEKQAAIGMLQLPDYKGTLRGIEFYGASDNLVGDYACDEGSGTTLNDRVTLNDGEDALTMTAVNPGPSFWTTI